MKNNNRMIPELYTVLSEELEKREPYLIPRTLSVGDRQRQGLALTNVRYFIAVLENHIQGRSGSVVFTIETLADFYALRFYRPLQPKECDRLAASGYAPILRSKIYLTVGLCKRDSLCYAYAEVKLSQYASLIDVFDALHTLGREMEKLLASTANL